MTVPLHGMPSSHTKSFVGTCIDSFDADGECLMAALSWNTVSDFACAEESATEVAAEFFASSVTLAGSVREFTAGHELRYLLTQEGILMLYDVHDDVHYLFA